MFVSFWLADRRRSKVISEAFNAAFHRLDQRLRPRLVGSKLIRAAGGPAWAQSPARLDAVPRTPGRVRPFPAVRVAALDTIFSSSLIALSSPGSFTGDNSALRKRQMLGGYPRCWLRSGHLPVPNGGD